VPSEERASEGPHAQFGEDRILERYFAGCEGGYCVEVGAYDGMTGSTTYLFEQKGWECLLVEPIPELASKIRENRSCRVVNCAVSGREGEATFYVAEHVEQMSTLDMTPGQRDWIDEVGGSLKEIIVPTRTLDSVLEDASFPRIDFMTIDVEGHEMDVLRGLSLERHRPRVIILEDNTGSRHSDVKRHMELHGYVNFRRTGVNDWYAHESDSELTDREALRQFHLEKAFRRSADRVKERIAPWVPNSLKERMGR
jgi:FkbM family methyltransferase